MGYGKDREIYSGISIYLNHVKKPYGKAIDIDIISSIRFKGAPHPM